MAKVFVCTGSCHGVATEEQFQNGATTCAAEACEKHGQPLVPRTQCESCASSAAKDGKRHACANCSD